MSSYEEFSYSPMIRNSNNNSESIHVNQHIDFYNTISFLIGLSLFLSSLCLRGPFIRGKVLMIDNYGDSSFT
jgi:hypothetical protein